MNFIIKSDLQGRLRVTGTTQSGKPRRRFSLEEAGGVMGYLEHCTGVLKVTVYASTAGIVISYEPDVNGQNRKNLMMVLLKLDLQNPEVQKMAREKIPVLELNHQYGEKLAKLTGGYLLRKLLLPPPVRLVLNVYKALHFFKKGLTVLVQRKLSVDVLDAAAISASLLRQDYSTAGTVMYLLRIGELLEAWTYKKSVSDLARSMSLNITKVWQVKDGKEVQVSLEKIQKDDFVAVKLGTVIPLDGVVVRGNALVNQASMTGEAIPVLKSAGISVYAGTVIEEGDLVLKASGRAGATRYERIIKMIENSENLKSKLESQAQSLADKLVPYTFLGTIATYLLTRNPAKALSILMVDFSCALKLSTPLTVLSAMRECSELKITVKGGKFLEAVAEAGTIVFDKTGTLTKAQPTVARLINCSSCYTDVQLLAYAACLEEHFPHSVANAIVRKAAELKLKHNEMHTKVEYIVAHGIVSKVNDLRIVIGSGHFVFEDEKCTVPAEAQKLYDSRPEEFSHIYMAIGGSLVAVICIHDPLREETVDVLRNLRRAGFKKLVMMTGDSRRTAAAIAAKLRLDEFYAEVLPEDKAEFIRQEKAAGRKVVMVGDGINDSPALSEADAGIAIAEGADIAKEVADITIGAQDLYQLVTLKLISRLLVERISSNYHFVISFNGGLIACGVLGILPPALLALLHNLSTIGVGLHSMRNILPEAGLYKLSPETEAVIKKLKAARTELGTGGPAETLSCV